VCLKNTKTHATRFIASGNMIDFDGFTGFSWIIDFQVFTRLSLVLKALLNSCTSKVHAGKGYCLGCNQ